MNVPSDTRTLIRVLEDIYVDRFETEPLTVEEYWKKAGVIELIRTLRHSVGSTELNNINVKD